MRYPAYSIAKRYLFSRKSTRVVNIISMITAFAMAIGTAALIIVMSVFNGFEDLVKSLYKVFYTDLVILPAEGKFFIPEEQTLQLLRETPGIAAYTEVLEENILAEFHGRQYIATMKGVDRNYYNVVTGLSKYIFDGSKDLYYDSIPVAVLGAGVAYALGINISLPNAMVSLYMPRNDKTALNDIANAFRNESIYPRGIFAVQQDFDNKYILVPIEFARNLMAEPVKVSAIEIRTSHPDKAKELQEKLTAGIGDQLIIKTRYEQNETLYKVMKTEKWAVFAILSFIVIIAAFNIVGSLSMLVIEKKQDIATLRALGADSALIQRIFLLEGMLMSLIGAITGLSIGAIICWLQIHIGIVPMPGSTFLVQYYPVQMQFTDFLLIGFICFGISALMAWLPARRAVKGLESVVPGRF